jgi:hypothetical protein
MSHAGSGRSIKSSRSGKSAKYIFPHGKSMKVPSDRLLNPSQDGLSGKSMLLQSDSLDDDAMPLIIDDIPIMTEQEAEEQDDGSEDDEVEGDLDEEDLLDNEFVRLADNEDDIEASRSEDLVV